MRSRKQAREQATNKTSITAPDHLYNMCHFGGFVAHHCHSCLLCASRASALPSSLRASVSLLWVQQKKRSAFRLFGAGGGPATTTGDSSAKGVAGSHHWEMLVKFLMVGDSSVGKTSVLTRFVDATFSTRFMTTIGVDYKGGCRCRRFPLA